MDNGSTTSPQYDLGFLWLICLVAALGGLLFGYDWVVIGGAKPFYEPFFQITVDTPLRRGWAQSSALFGCLIGALMSGVLSDRLGRKRLLILAGLLFTLSAVGTGLADRFAVFNAYRILGGLGIGLASNLSPMYIAEVSPATMRGRFVSINQLTIVIGILAAQIINWQIAEPVSVGATTELILASWNGQSGWRWMFWAETVPAVLFFLAMFYIPESPRWLVKSGRNDQAHQILARIGGSDYARAEVDSISATLAAEEVARVNFGDLLEPKVRRIVIVGVVLAVFQQWCGINVIFNYAQDVFAAAGYGVSGIMWNIVITGTVNLAFTFVAILTVDRIGRRKLMLIGAAGLALIYSVLGIGYFLQSQGVHMLVLVVMAIACYAMSLAPVTWVIIAEIFPNRIRGAAVAVAVCALWIACAVLTLSFPYLKAAFGAHGVFWIYAVVCLLGYLYIFKNLPETKGKSLEQIERELVD
jgi:SP family arabinose:H+ symporter-like MFS transporter